MTLIKVPALTIFAIIGLGIPAEAQTPCPELLQLRNAATKVWNEAMGAPRWKRCEVFGHASSAAKATLKYAENNRESCNISVRLLNDVEGYHRQAVEARGNACAGRPLMPFPADIIRR
jgi:hypothetical protein